MSANSITVDDPGSIRTTSLPDEPLITIEPSPSWSALNLREVWSHRELLFFLAWRDLKIRYKQTALGIAWVVLQPALLTIIFTVILGKLARVPSEAGVPYPLFIFAGIMPWTFFSSSVTAGGSSLVANSHLITKVYFPRLIIPIAALGARLVDLGIAFVLLIGLMIYYGFVPTVNILALPLLMVLTILLTLAFSTLAAAFNVKYRDVGVIMPVLMQLWMFLSPVIYPSSLVPQNWRIAYSLNPLVGLIDGFRAALFGRPFNWIALAISAVISMTVLVCSLYIFRRTEKGFADII